MPDMDVLPSDLVTYGGEAKKLLEDLQSRNERMFLVTVLIMNTADTKRKLDNIIMQTAGIAQKYNCALKRLDYQQEAGVMSSLPIGINQIDIQRGLTTSATAIFVPFTTEELFQDTEKTTETESEEADEETEESAGAFSESGNLSLLDDVGADKAKNLEYMTVQTKSGAVFYLVIDKSADTENVYFLNQVDELDLMAIMDDAQKQEYESSLKEEPQEVPETPIEDEPTADEPVDEEPQADLQTNNLALFGVIGVIAALVMGGYAFIKKKAKKDGADLDEDLEFYDDEEYENEDEQEPEFAEEEDVD